MGFPLPGIAGWPTGIWMTVGALSIALGVWPDIGALMLCTFAIIALYFHRFWTLEDESQKQMQQQLFFRNMIHRGGRTVAVRVLRLCRACAPVLYHGAVESPQ
jgi:putative oxidoreductase